MSGAWRLRASVLTLIGSLVVHQGRYLAVPRHDEHHAEAHAYFEWLVPALAAVAFVVVAEFALRLVRAHREAPPGLPSAGRLWAAATLALVAIFGAQEAIEGFVTHGAWPTPTELLAAGGWSALPLAIAVGGAVALLLRGAAEAVEWARRPLSVHAARAQQLRLPPAPVLALRGSVLARRMAGRAPPLAR
jgi:hypothetical protein